MSLNAALNATIALIENRPAQFREMLREPTSDVKNISPVYARMMRSLDFYAATKIRFALMAALHIQPPDFKTTEYDQAFFEGVSAVEKVFEGVLNGLEAQ